MVRELSLVKATDQFTFIGNINITPNSNHRDEFTTENLLSENLIKPDQDSQKDFSSKQLSGEQLSDLQTQDSSDLLPINQQNLSSHLSLNNHPISISDLWFQTEFQDTNCSALVPVILIPPLENNDPEPEPKSYNYLDKLLVVAAIGYCGLLGWSLFGAQNSIFPTALLRTNRPTISQADFEFLEYFEESLAVIDSKPNQKNSSSNNQANNKAKKDEVVYLPVYTPTPPVRSNSNNFPLQPNSLLPPPPPPNNFAAFNPPVSSSPIKQSAPPAISSKAAEQLKTPAPEQLKAPAPEQLSVASSKAPILNNSEPAKAQKVAPKPQIQPTLVGIIELKTNSAALFNVNGSTEKIWVGETVGNTGWKLESITNQKAQIAYQGKNLTLGIGQSFSTER